MVIPNTVKIIETWSFISNQITNITIPNSVISIGDNAFRSNNLTSIVIPDGVTSIGYGCFSNNKLIDVTIPSSLTDFSLGCWSSKCLNPFYQNPTLETLIVDKDNPKYVSINDAIYTKDMKTLVFGTKNAANNILETTTTIGYSAFYRMDIPSVTIGHNVKKIEESSFSYNNLESLIIPDSVVELESYSFGDNTLLKKITIGTGLSKFGNFDGENPPTSIPFESDGASEREDGCSWSIYTYQPFSGSNKIQEIVVSSDNPYYKSYNNTIYSKNGYWLVAGSIDPLATTVADGTIGINRGAFYSMFISSNLILPTSIKYIGAYAFNYTSAKNTPLNLPNVEYLGANSLNYYAGKNIYIGDKIVIVDFGAIGNGVNVTINKKESEVQYYKKGCSSLGYNNTVTFLPE